MTVKELAAKRQAAAKRAQDILALAREENRGLTADEQQTLDGHVDEAKSWQEKEKSERDREEQLKAISDLAGPGDAQDAVEPRQQNQDEELNIVKRINASPEYKAFRAGNLKTANVLTLSDAEFKTLVTLTTIAPQAVRRPNFVAMALEERTVADLMLSSAIDRPVAEYYEETTVTNSAAIVDEAGTKPESALAFTLRTDTVRKIATWIPATDEALADVPFLEGQIRGRLVFMVKRTEEAQILSGDGTGVNLTGILVRSNVQTQAKGADSAPTALFKAITKVRNTGFAEPTAIVMHPTDWQNMVLLQGSDGQYLFGPLSQNLPERVWGMDIRVTSAMTVGTALVGAFRPYAEVLRRAGITVTLSTEHSTYFVENKVAILAEERLGLAVYRPTAFCKVTGL